MDRQRAVLIVGVLVLLAGGGQADPVKKLVERTVLLPDGQPAAGLKVIIRTFGPGGIGVTDYEATTDEQGRFAREVPVEVVKFDPMNQWRDGYVLIAAPGCALALAVLDPSARLTGWHGPSPTTELKLKPAFAVAGQVLGPDKTPVAGATVTIHHLGGGLGQPLWHLNSPEKQVTTPQASATTGGDGRFVLPGLWAEKDDLLSGYCEARAPGLKTVDQPYFNCNPRFVQPLNLTLAPTFTVRARVLDPAGKPVAGATVTPYGEPWAAIKRAGVQTTGADGTCAWADQPRFRELCLQALHPDFAMGEAPVSLKEAEAFAEVYLRALAPLAGRIVEAETGQAPAVLPAYVSAQYQGPRSTSYEMNSIPGASVRGPVQPDGTFTLRTAVGSNRVRIENSLYEEPRYFSVDVPAAGLTAAEIRVTKRLVFFVQFTADDPAKLAGLNLRFRQTPEGQPTNPAPGIINGRWVWTTKAWGDKVEIEVTQKGQVVVPWTTVTADPANWPQLVNIP